MSTPEEAQKAIDALNGKELGGRALTVNIAASRGTPRRRRRRRTWWLCGAAVAVRGRDRY